MCFFFFFSSRRRHTRCALVTGVQTCALPICAASCAEFSRFGRTRRPMTIPIDPLKLITAAAAPLIKAVGREYKLRGADEKLIAFTGIDAEMRSDEHTSELQSLMRISYAVFCLKTNSLNICKLTS